MIANTKRFKNEIANLRKQVFDNFTDKEFALRNYLSMGKEGYFMRLEFEYTFNCEERFMMYENADGVIYFGIDLSNAKYGYNLENLIKEVRFSKLEWMNPEDAAKDPFFEGSPYDFAELQRNKGKVTQIPGYQKLKNRVIEVNDTIKSTVTLRDGQFPTLKKRDLLPIAWVSFEKGQLNVTTGHYTDSYRKSIMTYNLTGASIYFSRAIRVCPRLLKVESDYKNKPNF